MYATMGLRLPYHPETGAGPSCGASIEPSQADDEVPSVSGARVAIGRSSTAREN
jgi:hypothetical protein